MIIDSVSKNNLSYEKNLGAYEAKHFSWGDYSAPMVNEKLQFLGANKIVLPIHFIRSKNEANE